MPDYLTVTCRLPASQEERLAAALETWPVLGCQVEDAGPDVAITVFLEEARAGAVPAVTEGLLSLGGRGLGTGHFAEQDWLAEYRRYVSPRAVGRCFWIDPDPSSPTAPPPGRLHLIVEPRQAFGTGSHESTQLVLMVLEDLPVEGRAVLDVGTGSGILSLAALGLGARWAAGFDIDQDAVFVARQTVAEQPCRARVALFAGPLAAVRADGGFGVVLANMIPNHFEPLLPDLRRLLGATGFLVLSGLMADQRASVEAELTRQRLVVERAVELGEWVALVCRLP